MSHMFEEGFCVRKPAWHGLAKVLPDYPGLDEGMKLAGHNHNIEEHVLALMEPEKAPVPLTGFKALKRSDTEAVVSVMPSSYEVIQNRVPWEILDGLFSQGVRWDTAGILKGKYNENLMEVKGQVYWCMSLIDEPTMITGDPSPMYPYLLATWSHDGSQSLRIRAITVRVVCANTHSMAMMGDGSDFDVKIKHFGNVGDRIATSKQVIARVKRDHSTFVEAMNDLADISVTEEMTHEFVETILPVPSGTGYIVTDRVRSNVERDRGKLWGVINGKTCEGIRHSAYGLVEAGVEYFDHIRKCRTPETYFQRNVMRVENTKGALVSTVKQIAGVN